MTSINARASRAALAAAAVVLASGAPAVVLTQPAAGARRPAGSLSAGAFQYDLSGTGTVPMLAARVEWPLARYAVAEGGVVAARPDRQFAGRETFLASEVQLQAQVPLGRFAPYLGAGAGAALRRADRRSAGELTASAAGGVRARLTERVGLRGELRVRGVGSGFSGAAAEWTAGVARRF